MINEIKNSVKIKALYLLIIVGLVVFIGFSVWYSQSTPNKSTTSSNKSATTPQNSLSDNGTIDTSKLAPVKSDVIKVTSAGGKVVTSPDKSYSLTIPDSWFYKFDNSASYSTLYTAKSEELLKSSPLAFYVLPKLCAPEPPTAGPQSRSFGTKKINIDGISGYRSESIDDSTSTVPNTKHIEYTLCKNDVGYFVSYSNKPGGPDFTTEYDAIVQTWKL